jgi:hypothetical protein
MLRSTLTRILRCIRDVAGGRGSMLPSDATNNVEVFVSVAGVVGFIIQPPAETPPVGPLRVFPGDDQPQHAKIS